MNQTVKSIKIHLDGVPETALWTLYNRAQEAMRNDGIIKDNLAIEIFQKMEYDFHLRFGSPEPSHAVRSLIMDRCILTWISSNPKGKIISLGEGFETQFYRVDNGSIHWSSLDLGEIIRVRSKLFPNHNRKEDISISVLDESWLTQLKSSSSVLIIAQGLFMYLKEEQVRTILQKIFSNFPNATILFDTIPRWMVRKTKKGWWKTHSYKVPQMHWGLNQNEIPVKIKEWFTFGIQINLHQYFFPRGFMKFLFAFINRNKYFQNKMNVIVKLKRTNIEGDIK